ncbi:MAG: pyridoxal-phosphate dependent enzyme [Gemmatimonadaceae bacterium]|nr:pyridoxal-phosphate dependent enzyme [Gemmatimonadaceae bacterium]
MRVHSWYSPTRTGSLAQEPKSSRIWQTGPSVSTPPIAVRGTCGRFRSPIRDSAPRAGVRSLNASAATISRLPTWPTTRPPWPARNTTTKCSTSPSRPTSSCWRGPTNPPSVPPWKPRCRPCAAGSSDAVRSIAPAAIAEAIGVIDPVFLATPQFEVESLGGAMGCSLTVKVETVNPIRSFKGRGAECFAATLPTDGPGLVCASAGNFGQGLAWAARRRGLVLDVFASTRANPLKIARMRALGATVHQAGDDFDASKDAARAWAEANGRRYVEDGREPAIAAGAGTIALELTRGGGTFDAWLIPLGNGAMLGGMAAWIRAHDPRAEVIGVCAAGAPSMQRSWARGAAVPTERADTIADGIAVRVPIPEAVESLMGVVDDVVLVDDETTLAAMRDLRRALGLLVEPAGAVGVAALAADRPRFAGRRVVTVLCGSNVTDEQVRSWDLHA